MRGTQWANKRELLPTDMSLVSLIQTPRPPQQDYANQRACLLLVGQRRRGGWVGIPQESDCLHPSQNHTLFFSPSTPVWNSMNAHTLLATASRAIQSLLHLPYPDSLPSDIAFYLEVQQDWKSIRKLKSRVLQKRSSWGKNIPSVHLECVAAFLSPNIQAQLTTVCRAWFQTLDPILHLTRPPICIQTDKHTFPLPEPLPEWDRRATRLALLNDKSFLALAYNVTCFEVTQPTIPSSVRTVFDPKLDVSKRRIPLKKSQGEDRSLPFVPYARYQDDCYELNWRNTSIRCTQNRKTYELPEDTRVSSILDLGVGPTIVVATVCWYSTLDSEFDESSSDEEDETGRRKDSVWVVIWSKSTTDILDSWIVQDATKDYLPRLLVNQWFIGFQYWSHVHFYTLEGTFWKEITFEFQHQPSILTRDGLWCLKSRTKLVFFPFLFCSKDPKRYERGGCGANQGKKSRKRSRLKRRKRIRADSCNEK
jgi:hypothetical protein